MLIFASNTFKTKQSVISRKKACRLPLLFWQSWKHFLPLGRLTNI